MTPTTCPHCGGALNPRPRLGLTERQAALLAFIRSYQERNGYAPSYREMADGVGLVSKGNIARLIEGLEERGWVERQPYKDRSVRVFPLYVHVAAHCDPATMRSGEAAVSTGAPRPDHRRDGGSPHG